MKSEKHKIVFDSNLLYCSLSDHDKVFNSNLSDIKSFIKKT